MTVGVGNGRSSVWAADGMNRTWNFPFKVLKASHVRLEVTDLAGVVSEVSGPFTVMGLSQSSGGSVVYPVEPASALPAGYKIRVLRRVPLEQPNRIGNQGGFHAGTHEDTFDLLAMQMQQVYEDGTARGLTAPFDDGLLDMTLPAKAARAGRTLEFDLDGRPIPGVRPQEIINAATAAVEAANDALEEAQGAVSTATSAAGTAWSAASTATGAATAASDALAETLGVKTAIDTTKGQVDQALSEALATRASVLVGSRAALKAIDPSKYQTVYLMEPGRAGPFIWATGNYTTQLAQDNEGIHIKANSAAASAGAWVRLVDQDINPQWFGMSPSGAGVDNVYALTRAILLSAGRWVTIPPGQYPMVGTIQIGGMAIRIRGYGADTTDLIWSSAAGVHGFDLGTGSNFISKLEIDNLGIKTQADSGGIAIAAKFAPTDTEQDVKITRCRVSGTVYGSNNWAYGIHLTNAAMPTLKDNFIVGRNGSQATISGKTVCGIMLTATQLAILPTLRDNHVLYFDCGIYVSSTGSKGIEGLRILDNDCIHCVEGIQVFGNTGYWPVQNIISGNHCEFFSRGITVHRVNDLWIRDNDFIADAGSTTASWGVELFGVNQALIAGNTIEDGAGTANTLLSGIKVENCTFVTVRDNVGRTPDVVVAFVGSTSGSTEDNNKQKGTGGRFIDLSSTVWNNSRPIVYSGTVLASGTGVSLPRNWTVTQEATGVYRVTHSMGLDTSAYRVAATCISSGAFLVQRIFKHSNYFQVCIMSTAGPLSSADFDFFMFR